MSQLLSKQEITMRCRILGVHITASVDDLKQARNRLAKLYHPDKHPQQVRKQMEERFKVIQDAYEYLTDNHPAIYQQYKDISDNVLTSKENPINRAHWVYKAVESYDN